jgi:hypothetical protein
MATRVTATSLDKVGVDLLDRGTLQLRCRACQCVWDFARGVDNRLPRYWWACPDCEERGMDASLPSPRRWQMARYQKALLKTKPRVVKAGHRKFKAVRKIA